MSTPVLQPSLPPVEAQIPAPHGLRCAAFLLDYTLVMLVVIFLPQPINFFLPLAVLVVYHAALVWLTQQTLGKALFGLKVERLGKVKPGVFWSIGRSALGYFVIDVWGAGIVAALLNKRHRCLHDYVFGSQVVFSGPEKMRASRLLDRFQKFADKQRSALIEKQKSVAAILGFWAFTSALAGKLQKLLGFLTHLGSAAPASSQSIATALSLKAAVAISVGAAAVSAGVARYVPPVRFVGEWLIAPHYLFVKPPDGWVKCSCPEAHAGAGAFYGFERWHEDGLACPE